MISELPVRLDKEGHTTVGVFLARLVLVFALGFAAALALGAAAFLGPGLAFVAVFVVVVFLGAPAFLGAAVLVLVVAAVFYSSVY